MGYTSEWAISAFQFRQIYTLRKKGGELRRRIELFSLRGDGEPADGYMGVTISADGKRHRRRVALGRQKYEGGGLSKRV